MRSGPRGPRGGPMARLLAPVLLLLIGAGAALRAATGEHPGELHRIGNANLFVEIEGSGAPLLLLPDGPGLDHSYFHPFFVPLGTGMSVVYLDPLGCGRSDERPAAEYTLDRMVADLEGVRATLGFARLNLLGQGLGQAVATLYADRYPARVERLIFLSASKRPRPFLNSRGLHDARTPEMLWAMGTAYDDRYLSVDGKFHEEYRLMAPLMFHRLTDRSYQNAFAARVTTAAGVRDAMDPKLAPGGGMAIDLTPALKRLRVPVLIVAGRHDLSASVADAEAVRDAVPGARLEILEESGCFPFAEQPVEFLKLLRDFLPVEKKEPERKNPVGAGGGI